MVQAYKNKKNACRQKCSKQIRYNPPSGITNGQQGQCPSSINTGWWWKHQITSSPNRSGQSNKNHQCHTTMSTNQPSVTGMNRTEGQQEGGGVGGSKEGAKVVGAGSKVGAVIVTCPPTTTTPYRCAREVNHHHDHQSYNNRNQSTISTKSTGGERAS